MKNFSEWLNELLVTRDGRTWWANYRYDLEHSNLDDEVKKDYEAAIEEWLASSTDPIHPIDLIKRVVRNYPLLFDLKGQRKPQELEDYSSVMDAGVLAYYYYQSKNGDEIDDMSGERLWQQLGVKITSANFEGKLLKTGRDFFWCSPTEGIKTCGEASVVRNKLGLVDKLQGQYLVRIDIPTHTLEGKILAPTTLDAGDSIIFTPCDDNDGLGWTMDLETLDRALRELVIEPVTLTLKFVYNRVGTGPIDQPVPDIDYDVVEKQATAR